MRPFFVTGAAAKIKLAGTTLAYCTDITYSVDANHFVPRVLGMYEGVSLEPISYIVNGSLSVIRYVKDHKANYEKKTLGAANALPRSISNNGNGIGALSGGATGPLGGAGTQFLRAFSSNAGGSKPRPYESFDPASFEAGNTFDIEIYQNTIDPTKVKTERVLQQTWSQKEYVNERGQVVKGRGAPVNYVNKLNVADATKSLPVVRIREARFTRLEGSMSKKSVLIERYSFTALYLDGDSFLARASGSYGITGDRFEKGEKG